MDTKKKNSIEIEVPLMVRTRLNFEFNPASPYGKTEALAIFIESDYFNLPLTTRRNPLMHSTEHKECAPINIPYNTSDTNQQITISGASKLYEGARTWIDSDMKLLQDKPFEKVIGFNSIFQPDNYETMKCTIVFHL